MGLDWIGLFLEKNKRRAVLKRVMKNSASNECVQFLDSLTKLMPNLISVIQAKLH